MNNLRVSEARCVRGRPQLGVVGIAVDSEGESMTLWCDVYTRQGALQRAWLVAVEYLGERHAADISIDAGTPMWDALDSAEARAALDKAWEELGPIAWEEP